MFKTSNNDNISRPNSRPKLPFPGNGKGNLKLPWEGKGREIWGLYSRESRETGIPAHPWCLGWFFWCHFEGGKQTFSQKTEPGVIMHNPLWQNHFSTNCSSLEIMLLKMQLCSVQDFMQHPLHRDQSQSDIEWWSYGDVDSPERQNLNHEWICPFVPRLACQALPAVPPYKWVRLCS